MYYIRYIGNMCLSDREVDSFNSKEELMEGRMNDMDNNRVKISVLNFFLDSFYRCGSRCILFLFYFWIYGVIYCYIEYYYRYHH